jgi:HEPN domain-containing protein
MNDKTLLWRGWLEKAAEDEGVAKEILDGKKFPAPTCFHCQQMAEKMLKALLIFNNVDVPKVHDLVALKSLLEQIISDISEINGDLLLLNQYYIETRYPGDYPEFSFKDAQEAFEAALRIKDFILGKITSEHE